MGVFRKVEILTDYTRKGTFQEESEFRKIVISIYYPDPDGLLENNESEMKYMDLFRPCEQQAREILQDIGMNMDIIGGLSTSISEGALQQKSKRSYPVIIYSPALGLDRDMYIYNIQALVKQEFIVVTVSAAYEAMFTVCPSGEFMNQSEVMRTIEATDYTELHHLISIRKKDIQHVLDHLSNLNSRMGIFDMDKVGMIGHSIGGATALDLTMEDDRIKAAVLLDASMHLYIENEVKNNTVPLLVLRQKASALEALSNILQEKIAKDFIKGQEKLFRNWNGYKSFLKIRKATHMSFSDMPLFEEDETLYQRTCGIHNQINELVANFFQEHLLDQGKDYSTFISQNHSDFCRINGSGDEISVN
ncbi:putative dienelactone hydrolase [Paenibacillus sp. PastF-3]|uniref:alpha/beta hydrolase family protein n=1 Tax=Paenibacillus sp. PastF-3 TaxID=2940626 RepID=UPI002473552E|nr:alpha/beta hydrolase [Paenibacillus sp. PastF-3]MDH6370460.1 putative dienelactone hydrolase [Paenibacillus sp. PastF-3]